MTIGNTITNYAPLIKEVLSSGVTDVAVMKNRPLLGMLTKEEKIGGSDFWRPHVYGVGQGDGGTLTQAQTNAAATGDLAKKFQITHRKYHRVITIDAELIKQTKHAPNGAFVEAAAKTLALGLSAGGAHVAREIYRSSTGTLGRIGSSTTLASSTLVLDDPNDVMNIDVGSTLTLSATDGGSARSGQLYVKARDVNAGTITIGQTPTPGATSSNITDATYGVSLAALGDYITKKSELNLCMAGLQSWIPATVASSGDSFFGVDRYADRMKLAGHYLDATSGYTILSAIRRAGALIGRAGGECNYAFVDPLVFDQAVSELEGKRSYVDVSSTSAKVGYRGIEIVTGGGTVVLMADPFCPHKEGFVLNLDDWVLESSDPIIALWSEDDLEWLRASTEAGMEARIFSYGNLRCDNLVNQARIKFYA